MPRPDGEDYRAVIALVRDAYTPGVFADETDCDPQQTVAREQFAQKLCDVIVSAAVRRADARHNQSERGSKAA